MAGAERGFLSGQLPVQMSPEGLSKKVKDVARGWIVRPTRVACKDCRQPVRASHLSNEGLELSRVTGRKAPEGQYLQPSVTDAVPKLVERVAHHVPRARRGKGLLVLRWLAPEVVGTQLNVFQHQRVDSRLPRPPQPIAMRDLEMDVHHAVDQRRGHRFDDRAVL